MGDEPETSRGDPNGDKLAEFARACLDHVRAVRFGEATSKYQMVEGDQVIEVSISVRCVRKAEQTNG